MDTYQYKYGDRPLEGYTIQRAAGRGGFSEVYYAISDSGRDVALKAIQSNEQVKLRGISQCMNLKSPYLVTIFDVKYNDQGRPFAIMEYVSGPSLAELLKESRRGLGTQKAAFFLREIGKGLSFLHECGIVHRDLKPGNIFYTNGYVKIGDYGLTKAISTNHHVSHTITVGTVHYMAPEIAEGKYDRSVDIYALGILLYEMLTGQVPFLGSSPAEILMKHMTAAPDLSNIEEPFASVIRKALAKNPAERYQRVQEMVEDVFGTEQIRNSVSQFAPEELSVVAAHVAEKMQGASPAGVAHKTSSGHVRHQQVVLCPSYEDCLTDVLEYKGVLRALHKRHFPNKKWEEFLVLITPLAVLWGLLLIVGVALSIKLGVWWVWIPLGPALITNIVAANRWSRSRFHSVWHFHCAELCSDGQDFIEFLDHAGQIRSGGMSREDVVHLLLNVAEKCRERGDTAMARKIYELAALRWRSPHAKQFLLGDGVDS